MTGRPALYNVVDSSEGVTNFSVQEAGQGSIVHPWAVILLKFYEGMTWQIYISTKCFRRFWRDNNWCFENFFNQFFQTPCNSDSGYSALKRHRFPPVSGDCSIQPTRDFPFSVTEINRSNIELNKICDRSWVAWSQMTAKMRWLVVGDLKKAA